MNSDIGRRERGAREKRWVRVYVLAWQRASGDGERVKKKEGGSGGKESKREVAGPHGAGADTPCCPDGNWYVAPFTCGNYHRHHTTSLAADGRTNQPDSTAASGRPHSSRR
jgi:hypothetical protein